MCLTSDEKYSNVQTPITVFLFALVFLVLYLVLSDITCTVMCTSTPTGKQCFTSVLPCLHVHQLTETRLYQSSAGTDVILLPESRQTVWGKEWLFLSCFHRRQYILIQFVIDYSMKSIRRVASVKVSDTLLFRKLLEDCFPTHTLIRSPFCSSLPE